MNIDTREMALIRENCLVRDSHVQWGLNSEHGQTKMSRVEGAKFNQARPIVPWDRGLI